MKPQYFLKELRRMCKGFGECGACPLNKIACFDNLQYISSEKFVQMYNVVAKWSDEHSEKTRQSEFLRKFPKAKLDEEGIVLILPCTIEKDSDEVKKCKAICADCYQCRKDYWLAPADDEQEVKTNDEK